MAVLRNGAFLTSILFLLSLSILLHNAASISSPDSSPQTPDQPISSQFASTNPPNRTESLTLGIFSKIYVVNLPSRVDRREQMERLRNALGLVWTYFPAFSRDTEVVSAIMQGIKMVREECLRKDCESTFISQHDVDQLASSDSPLNLFSSDFLHPADIPGLSKTWLRPSTDPPLPCARGNLTFPKDKQGKPVSGLLTPAVVGCFHSHLSVIQRVANKAMLELADPVLILEDDVDMESDIHAQLETLWPSLPHDWDIVFLGHCGSNEARLPPLSKPNPRFPSFSHLHSSQSPLCAHAYALSSKGARRLLSYLQYAPFAYSRVIDVAFAELVRRKMLKAYSVVPSIVVQRKLLTSDLWPGTGDWWKGILRNGVLDRLDTLQKK